LAKKMTDGLEQHIIQIVRESKPENVNQLILLVQGKFSLPYREILRTIMELHNQGKIELATQSSLTSIRFAAYLKTEQALWYWATLTLTIAAAAVVFTVSEDLYPWVYIRYILGTIFMLWLPGYLFIKALFPTSHPLARPLETSGKALDTVERIALSLGMSISLVALIGLLLNYTPWGIRLAPIVSSLVALTTVFATAAVIREHRVKMEKKQ